MPRYAARGDGRHRGADQRFSSCLVRELSDGHPSDGDPSPVMVALQAIPAVVVAQPCRAVPAVNDGNGLAFRHANVGARSR
jgi:hypothetical protein